MTRNLTAALAALLYLLPAALPAAAPPPGNPDLAGKALAVLRTHCYRCHGQDGSVEGGLNYVLDAGRLIARRKVVPGQPERSPLYTRMKSGKMPPRDVVHRPAAADLAAVERWIRSGAEVPAAPREFVPEPRVQEWILADLERVERRARRFARYFSLVPLANAGASPDELQTHRNALAKLLNSLSWHPKIAIPRPVGPGGLILAIDLRDYLLDANLWNRLLNDYPYGILHDTGVSRAVLVATATRMPVVRADWFVATASRAPLYYDLLQIPANLGDLERQLRVDVAANLLQERVARAGFNGSGISRNNRILERHDAMNGAYWRTYDFEAVPQNLIERNILLPDRRNVFAYPLGPGGAETLFQHAGGEVIFNLPNGLQGYVLVNANNQRVNKGPADIVSDPKRPDRAVEAGLSCIHCHATGINVKDDQLREHVRKNRKAFTRTDAELVEALYPPAKKMRQLMEEDSLRFQKAVEKTGNRANAAEAILAMTLRYEADVDLPTLAAEVGTRPETVLARLAGTENVARNLGALKVAGGTVSRQVVVQSFGDLVRELKLGTVLEVGRQGETLADATGEADPLEAQSSRANAMAFSPDGKLAAFASADRSVVIHDVEGGRDLRRCIGHTASVWAVAFSPGGRRILSGGKDGTVRLWETETARELLKIDAHLDLVSAVTFSPGGRRAASAGYDQEVVLWDLEKGARVAGFAGLGVARYVHSLAFSPDGKLLLAAGERTVHLLDAATARPVRAFEGHAGWINQVTFSSDGKRAVSASDDGTARLWDVTSGKEVQAFRGHGGPVKSAAIAPDGKHTVTAGADSTVRLWDANTAKEVKVFGKHTEPVVAVKFGGSGKYTLSGTRTGEVEPWNVAKLVVAPPVTPPRPAVEYPASTLRPEAAIPVGGTVGQMLLSPDGGLLYYLDRTAGTVGRIDTGTLKRSFTAGWSVEVLGLSPDGKTLVGIGAEPKSRTPALLRIGPASMRVEDHFGLEFAGDEVAVRNDGVAAVTGKREKGGTAGAFDVRSRRWVSRWETDWGQLFLGLHPDGRRLFASTRDAVPGVLETATLPAGTGRFSRPPAVRRVGQREKHEAGGPFTISPDGRYLVFHNGAVLRLSDNREDDPTPHVRIERHLSFAVDVQGKAAYAISLDGQVVRYAYPDFVKQGTWRPALAAYRVAVDGRAGKLYVAGFDPRSVAENPRARGYGDIHVYRIEEMTAKGGK